VLYYKGESNENQKKNGVILENYHVTVNKVAAILDVSHGSPHHIIHDVLQFHRVNAK
jgi:hypothetical protein